ncbi:MAG TPA: M28 family peptidase, partial [Steroidobacteraceae bacterium]
MQYSRTAMLIAGVATGLVSAAWAAPDPVADLRLPVNVAAAMRDIDPERIRAHVRFLSDDLLEGRGTGARGGDVAAKYIATQFALDGLKPAGDDGGYLQKVEFTGEHTLPATASSLQPQHGKALGLRLGEDYVVSNQTQAGSVDIDAPIVFAGYGIEAPEYRWNDFKGVDVAGKVVLVIVNEPPSKDPKFFNAEAMTYYGRWTYKFEEAARKGAVGALIIHRTDLASYGWGVVRNSWSGESVYLRNDKDPKLKAASWIQLDVARQLFSASGLNLDDMMASAGKRGFKARELPVRFKAHIVSAVRNFNSYNVLGWVPGTDAGEPSQAVIYSAHYDHLGIDPTMSGDNIYNGAVDNGTGVGILLELAHAYASSRARPPHPV